MRVARYITVLALLLVVAGCNSDLLPPAAQSAVLQGVILEQGTNRPIVGATVTVDSVLTATTDSSGKFTIAKIPSGDFDYTVAAKGYKLVSASGSAEPGKVFVLNVSLQSSPSP
jgi:carboxypeptidase family protein